MTKRINLFIMVSLLSVLAMAQGKKSFTLDDLLPGGSTYHQLQPQNLYTAWWGNRLVETDLDGCNEINPKNGSKKVLFTLSQLNQWLGAGEDSSVVRSCYNVEFPDGGQPWVATVVSGKGKNGGRPTSIYTVVDFKSGKKVWEQEYPADATALDRSPSSNSLAFVRQHNLYVTTKEGQTMAVSSDGSNDLVYGETVHRNEFGITKGTFWSPDGKQLAFYRMDQSMVPDYPQVDITTRIATTYPCKYPMAGEKMHKVTVGVFTPATGRTVWLQTGDPTDRYFTNISWSPDNRKIYMIELNRDQNHAELVCYDAATGKKEGVIYEEEHPKYVEPMHGLLFLPWDSSKFIYQSQRDGYNHLYLFDLSKPQAPQRHKTFQGGACEEHVEVTPLTSGEWVVKEVLGFNLKEKSLLFCSNEIHPLQSNIGRQTYPFGQRRRRTLR